VQLSIDETMDTPWHYEVAKRLQPPPTPDHYLPLLYVLAQYRDGDAVNFPVQGSDGGSISMLAVQIA